MSGVRVGKQPSPKPGSIGRRLVQNGSETDSSELTICDFWKEAQEKNLPVTTPSLGHKKHSLWKKKPINQISSKVKPSAHQRCH